ncbi:MAG: hypothetical protein JJU42_04545 [Rhodobacteraceae bacterium]|nr:hypothetical protein [Paracoccaceae bacterium]
MDLWLRPWAFYAPDQRHDRTSDEVRLAGTDATLTLVRYAGNTPPTIDRPTDPAEPHVDLRTAGGEAVQLAQLPLPLRPARGLMLRDGPDAVLLQWPDLPDRPREKGHGAQHEPGVPLLQRARAVWDRIQDVEQALSDPATLWQELHRRWTGEDAGMPQMHVIVRHAREVSAVLERLGRRPRKVLRRVNRSLPVGRVQEIDRRAMLWMARQPGEQLAEKAGDRQRLLAVAREENFDILENRVLRAYAELAARVGNDYLERNRTRGATRRARDVKRFVQRCQQLVRDLRAKGVRLAEPGVTPNFVLQQNPDYHAIWVSWNELRNQDRIEDDLWRWQAMSWAEYCALVLMVALIAVPGAQVVATAPIWFRDEQRRGTWIEADSPLGVVYLPTEGLVVEVANARDGGAMTRLGAKLLLRLRQVGDEAGFSATIPVWPLWAVDGGLAARDLQEILNAFTHFPGSSRPRGGIVMRPSVSAERPEVQRSDICAAFALGTDGPALRETLGNLTGYLRSVLREAAP